MIDPRCFRETLNAIPFLERDTWVDRTLGLSAIPPDDASLPRDGVPYMPAPVDALMHVAALMQPSDVLIDVGAGIGRAAMVIHLLSGARAVGIEIQPSLVAHGQSAISRLALDGAVTLVQREAVSAVDQLSMGTVFFLYCPFSGERLERLMHVLEQIAKRRSILVAVVDAPLPQCSWLTALPAPSPSLEVFRSTASSRWA